MNKEKLILMMNICQRAEQLGYVGNRQTLLMDLESADAVFNMRFQDMLNANDINFLHDIIGITRNIVRDTYPATDFGYFVPRFANVK